MSTHAPYVSSPGKIKIGYFSADFRDHPVTQLLVELIETHDRSSFEAIGFSFRPADESPLGKRIAQAFDRFVDTSRMSDNALKALADEIGLDIAVNLSGHTGGSRNSVFAQRIAPVQVNYLGFPGTMGAEYMDYLITDAVVCPPGSESGYSEKLARLPHCFMPHDSQQAIADQPPSRTASGLPEKGFVFCCFNNHHKITPEVFDIWMRLLKHEPDSVLWLSDGSELLKSNLRREAKARGVQPERLVFARRVGAMAEHLARYRLADLFLDTLPYNAHTTACDALWAGVPVLTRIGQSFAGRVAASLLHAVGLPELVTDSPETYEQLASELAGDQARLMALRNKLEAAKRTAPLFDTRMLTRHMEELFSVMHQRALAGLPPCHLTPQGPCA